MAMDAFDLAERFQQLVFVMSDLDLGMNMWMAQPFPYPTKTPDRGKVLDANDRVVKNYSDTGVPAFLFNLGAEYDLPMVPGLTFTARYLHTGKQYFDVANTASISSWNRFDLGARYATDLFHKNTTFRVSVLNVANKAYWESAATSGQGYLTQGAPRTFLFSMTTDF